MSEKQLIEIYLDFKNHFLTVEGYARYYNMPPLLAKDLLLYAKRIYNLNVGEF